MGLDDHNRYCERPTCDEPSMDDSHPFCAMHSRRMSRGTPMDQPKRELYNPKERLIVAALGLADCDSEDDEEYRKAEARLVAAAKAITKNCAEPDSKRANACLASIRIQEIARMGAIARAKILTPERRIEIARIASAIRWRAFRAARGR